MNSKDFAALAKSHRLIAALTVIGFLIIALVLFEAGVAVGFRKASFASHWQDSYARDFGNPRRMIVLPAGIPNPNGAAGTVVSVSLPTFAVAGSGEPEKTVRINADTLIREGSSIATSSDIQAGQTVIVIGKPSDDGIVDAALIRILPSDSDDRVYQAQP